MCDFSSGEWIETERLAEVKPFKGGGGERERERERERGRERERERDRE